MSLVSIPDFSFAVTLYEYVNLMILPGLEAFIHYFIRDIILRPMVLPESLTVPLVVRAAAGQTNIKLQCLLSMTFPSARAREMLPSSA